MKKVISCGIGLFIASLMWQWYSYVWFPTTITFGLAITIASALSILSYAIQQMATKETYLTYVKMWGFSVIITILTHILIWTGNIQPHIFG